LLIVLHYLIAFDPNENPFRQESPTSSTSQSEWKPNPVDLVVTTFLRSAFKKLFTQYLDATRPLGWLASTFRKPRWKEAFTNSILGLCDAQLLTGLGILISGFADLQAGLSAYHFQVITQLAWFSNLTHVAGLTVLRRYLHEHRAEKLWRLSFMGILTVMLLVAVVPTLFFNWPNDGEFSASNATSYAVCFYDTQRARDWYMNDICRFLARNEGSELDLSQCLAMVTTRQYSYLTVRLSDTSAFQSTIVSITLLTLTFLSRLTKLVAPLTGGAKAIRRALSERYYDFMRGLGTPTPKQRSKSPKAVRLSAMELRLSVLLWFRLYTDILTSTISDVMFSQRLNLITATVLTNDTFRYIGF